MESNPNVAHLSGKERDKLKSRAKELARTIDRALKLSRENFEGLHITGNLRIAAEEVHLLQKAIENGGNNMLPTKKADYHMLSPDRQMECCVCLDTTVSGTQVTLLPCTHWLHAKCVEEWLETRDVCPLCRQKVDWVSERSSV